MLVLTRKPGEKILIGDNVIITLLGVKGCQVRIGVEAPRNISVDREEIWEKKKIEKDNIKD